jgi:glycosyltransferase involved in cell wall biosynthesis
VSLRYAVVTPARDEQVNLRRLYSAMVAQTLQPDVWVLVDDGSADATRALMQELACTHSWIQPLERPGAVRDDPLTEGRRAARPLIGFLVGAAQLRDQVDVIVKVDADIDFEPDYFERLIGRFQADPLLGIASGTCYERESGRWVRRTKPESSVWGASRAYRSECIADVMALEPRMGWDGLDEVRVQLRGLRTTTFVDLPFRHHRPEGGRELSSLHHGEALGATAWYMGYRPSYLMLRAFYRARREPAAIAMVWGYFRSAVRRVPRCADAELVRALRERQRLRPTLVRGIPRS